MTLATLLYNRSMTVTMQTISYLLVTVICTIMNSHCATSECHIYSHCDSDARVIQNTHHVNEKDMCK